MDIAAMNERVMIQANAVVTDRYGNHRNSWEDYFSCYATISGENGKEQAVVGEKLESTDMNVTVRYCTQTAAVRSTTHRILFRGEIYDIAAVDHLNYRKRGIRFRCRKARR